MEIYKNIISEYKFNFLENFLNTLDINVYNGIHLYMMTYNLHVYKIQYFQSVCKIY